MAAFTTITDGDYFLGVSDVLEELIDAYQERYEAIHGTTDSDLSDPIVEEHWLEAGQSTDTIEVLQAGIDALMSHFIDDTTYFNTAGSITAPVEEADIIDSVGNSDFFDAYTEVFNTLTYNGVLSQSGFTRKYRTAGGAINSTTGLIQSGDLMGLWILDEMQTMLEAMTVSKISYQSPVTRSGSMPDPTRQRVIWRAKSTSGGTVYSGLGDDAVVGTAQSDASTDYSDQSPSTTILTHGVHDWGGSDYAHLFLMDYEEVRVETVTGANLFTAIKRGSEANWYNNTIPTHRTRTVRAYALPLKPLREDISGWDESEFFASGSYTEKTPTLISTSTAATVSLSFGNASTTPTDATNTPDNDPTGGDDPEQYREGAWFLPLGVVVWTFNLA